MSMFQRVTRRQVNLRAALVGPSGSGKTFTALRWAMALTGNDGSQIAAICTERGAVRKYIGQVNPDGGIFDALVCDLEEHDPRTYIRAIEEAGSSGIKVLIIDSLSHAWMGRGGLLEQVDNHAKRNKGNSFGAWRDATPLHNALIDAILSYPGHVICTMRAKTEYAIDKDKHGKTTVRKLGLAPEQRGGMEYEFDLVCDVDHEHNLAVTKTRISAVTDKVEKFPGAKFLAPIIEWCGEGEPAPASAPKPTPRPDGAAPKTDDDAHADWYEYGDTFRRAIEDRGVTLAQVDAFCSAQGLPSPRAIAQDRYNGFLKYIEDNKAAITAKEQS